jgi:hypothetical protein
MNTINLIGAVQVAGHGIRELLIGFLILVVVLAIIGGLVYMIETWIHPLPPPVKLVLAVILVILVIIWGINYFTGP